MGHKKHRKLKDNAHKKNLKSLHGNTTDTAKNNVRHHKTIAHACALSRTPPSLNDDAST